MEGVVAVEAACQGGVAEEVVEVVEVAEAAEAAEAVVAVAVPEGVLALCVVLEEVVEVAPAAV